MRSHESMYKSFCRFERYWKLTNLTYIVQSSKALLQIFPTWVIIAMHMTVKPWAQISYTFHGFDVNAVNLNWISWIDMDFRQLMTHTN